MKYNAILTGMSAAVVAVSISTSLMADKEKVATMGNDLEMRWTPYAWGPECADGLVIGLSLSGRVFGVSAPVPWRWALCNHADEARQVTVDSDLDTSFRYRLQIFRAGRTEPVEEFAPRIREPFTTTNVAHSVSVAKGWTTELEPEEANVGARLGPGNYYLRVLFGGPGFNFECVSGFAEIEVKQ